MKNLKRITTLLSLAGLLLIMNNSCEPECETCQEPPKASDQTFSVAEESPGGTSVGFITAESASEDLRYHMVSDIAAHYFVINETTGEITVRDSAVLDYETQQSYTFDAIVTEAGDDGFSVTLTITINITNSDELKKGLVAYYPFNGNANDESGNENHGELRNDPTLVSDRFGNANSAYDFDGVNDYIYVPHSESIDLDEKISISVWVVLEQINSYNMIISKRYGDTTQYQLGVRGAEGYGDLNFFTSVSKPGNDHDISYSFPTQQWVHMVVTADDVTDETKYYINGEYVGTNTSDVLLRSTKTELRIGENTWSNGYWEGTIDDIRIYNRVLDESEIQSLYTENGWTGDTSNIDLKNGLVAQYPFNGNANDESGNGNHGELRNDPTLVSDRFGNDNSAYDFDGVNDYIYVPHSESIDLDEKISISVWVVLEQINSYNMIISKRYGDTTQYQLGVRGAEGYGDLNFFTSVSKPGNDHDISYSFPTQQWVHMVVTADDVTDETKYYINGEYVGTNTSDVLLRSTKTELRIGENTWSNGYWEGTIDDIRIYNRVLNEFEINALYTQNGWSK